MARATVMHYNHLTAISLLFPTHSLRALRNGSFEIPPQLLPSAHSVGPFSELIAHWKYIYLSRDEPHTREKKNQSLTFTCLHMAFAMCGDELGEGISLSLSLSLSVCVWMNALMNGISFQVLCPNSCQRVREYFPTWGRAHLTSVSECVPIFCYL